MSTERKKALQDALNSLNGDEVKKLDLIGKYLKAKVTDDYPVLAKMMSVDAKFENDGRAKFEINFTNPSVADNIQVTQGVAQHLKQVFRSSHIEIMTGSDMVTVVGKIGDIIGQTRRNDRPYFIEAEKASSDRSLL